MICIRCGNSLSAGEALCSSCGCISPGSRAMECEQHAGVNAIAGCVVCGKPLCGDCATWTGSSFHCDQPAHRDFAEGWTVVASCASVFEADMLATNLRQGGFSPVTFNPGELVGAFWHPELSTARVLVAKADYPKARALLESLALVEIK